MAIKLKPKRTAVWVTMGLCTAICTALYPIFIYPMLHIDEYKESQRINRKDINREAVQPGKMRVWSDPFSPRPDEK